MKKEILDPKHLYEIHKEKKLFHLIGEPLMGMVGTTEIINSCLYMNDEFKDFKKCVENSLDDLRKSEEIYGFSEFDDEEE